MLKIFSGRSNEPLAENIEKYLLNPASCRALETGFEGLGRLDKKRNFSDRELYIRYEESIRGCDVFIIQSTNEPAENFQELVMMIDAARGASADRKTAVIPYFGYARQDTKDKSRANVTAITQVKMLHSVGADRLLLLDVHSSAVENACWALDMKCDHLWARPIFIKYLLSDDYFQQFMAEGFVVAGPDLNAGKLARRYAETFGVPLALIEKRRDVGSGKTSVLNVIGDVKNKNVLLVDDMIDTAGTTCDGAEAFKREGASRICALATHGVFSGEAYQKIDQSSIERVLVTDSISGDYNNHTKIKAVPVANLLGEAVYRIHMNKSVSSLFD